MATEHDPPTDEDMCDMIKSSRAATEWNSVVMLLLFQAFN